MDLGLPNLEIFHVEKHTRAAPRDAIQSQGGEFVTWFCFFQVGPGWRKQPLDVGDKT